MRSEVKGTGALKPEVIQESSRMQSFWSGQVEMAKVLRSAVTQEGIRMNFVRLVQDVVREGYESGNG